MEQDHNYRTENKPAAYPKTSTTETRSKDVFQYLIDRQFIQGEIRVLDKVPNVDGTLEITDALLHPIGKIEIQLKTLDPKNYHSPKYSCEPEFISFCEISTLPVFLVVVDIANEKAYWRHIDHRTISEFRTKITGNTYTLSVPITNCIDRSDRSYIQAWSNIVNQVREILHGFESLNLENKKNKERLDALLKKLYNPVDLPLQNIKEIHNFLDHYNYILDKEFPTVRQMLYPNYWKIGIGIISYQYNNLQFILYPVEFNKSQTLVKMVDKEEYPDINMQMYDGHVLLIARNNNTDCIREKPVQYAYKLLDSTILDVAGKKNFPIPNDFIAHEYLISFIDKFYAYLDLPGEENSYSIADLDFRLRYVLPMMIGSSPGFADWVTEDDYWIDSEENFKNSPQHKKKIADSFNKVKSGFVPKVNVTIYSSQYDIKVIYYYIQWLTKRGIHNAIRKYQAGQRDTKMIGVDQWRTWNKDVLWNNLQIFFQHFFRIYDIYIDTHFPYIKESLKIVPNKQTTIVCVFKHNLEKPTRPWLEIFYLKPLGGEPQEGKVFSYTEHDSNAPVSYRAFVEKKYNCTIDGVDYIIEEIKTRPLDFMFKYSPTYEFLNEFLSKELKRFFSEKSKHEK